MGRCVLDTSILIALERRHLDASEIIFQDEDVLVPAIAIAEYMVGMHLSSNAREKELINRNLEVLERMATILEFGEKEAKAFAILQSEAFKSGKGRSDFDLAIAAHSVIENAILVTRDKNARLSELSGVVTREV